jgi:Mor family transcriptional regulator
MPHTGLKPISRLHIKSAVFDLLDDFFGAFPARRTGKSALTARNVHIAARFADGEPIDNLAKAFGLTYQRIHQIVHSQ